MNEVPQKLHNLICSTWHNIMINLERKNASEKLMSVAHKLHCIVVEKMLQFPDKKGEKYTQHAGYSKA